MFSHFDTKHTCDRRTELPWHIGLGYSMCAVARKNRMYLYFGSFPDIRENAEWPRFLAHHV